MNLRTLSLGPLATNCYIIYDNTAVIVDPAFEPENILEELEKISVTLTHIIYTHAHLDHTGAGFELKDRTGAQVILGEKDMGIFNNSESSLKYWPELGGKSADPDRLVREGDKIISNGIQLEVLFTPGHTPGSISLFTPGIIFSGDTIFLNSVGRTDLPGGDFDELRKSIINKIFTLDDNVQIYPGHGPKTSVGWEKNNNPFIDNLK